MKSVVAAMPKPSQLVPFTQRSSHTPLGNARRIDHSIRPAVTALDSFVPVILDWRALGEDNSGVKDTGDGVECNKHPEEDLPFLILETGFAVC